MGLPRRPVSARGPRGCSRVLAPGPGRAPTRSCASSSIVPFNAAASEREEQWMGEGVAQSWRWAWPSARRSSRSSARACGRCRRADAWTEAAGGSGGARGTRRRGPLRASSAPRQTSRRPPSCRDQGRAGGPGPRAVVAPEGEFLATLSTLPVGYASTLNVSADRRRRRPHRKAAQPDPVARAFEQFARGQTAARRGDQEGNEAAVDLLTRAIEVDPSFVVARYSLGGVHQALGNRWKAAAQFRASTQLDPRIRSQRRRSAISLSRLPVASSTRRSRPTTRRSSSGHSTPTPTWGSATPRPPRARSTAPSPRTEGPRLDAANPRVHMSLGKIY